MESEKASAWKGNEEGFRIGEVETNAVENTDEGNEGKEKQQERKKKIEAEGGKRREKKEKGRQTWNVLKNKLITRRRLRRNHRFSWTKIFITYLLKPSLWMVHYT